MPTAKDLMSTNVLTAKTSTSFSDVVKVFTSSKINHLPITNTDGTLRALISSTDVLKAMHEIDQFARYTNGFSIENKLAVRDEMSSDVISITKDTDINEIVKLMVEHNIRSLPVMDDDMVAGIITSNDILKAIYNGKLSVINKNVAK